MDRIDELERRIRRLEKSRSRLWIALAIVFLFFGYHLIDLKDRVTGHGIMIERFDRIINAIAR